MLRVMSATLFRNQKSRVYKNAASLYSIRGFSTDPDKIAPAVVNSKNLGKIALYAQLAKFRLSSLVVLTSGAGYVCYGPIIDPMTLAGAELCI